MEQLEGKYFENTILALKEAREGEKFNMRPEFKAELRAAIVNRAIGVADLQEERPGWAETVLKFRYLLAGVPVLAALALVATNLGSLKTNFKSEEIVPVAQENSVVTQPVKVSDLSTNSLQVTNTAPFNPQIVTFSADSVMPPADVLARAREIQQNGGEVTLPTNNDVGNQNAFFGQEAPSAKLSQTKPTIYSYTSTTNNIPVTSVAVPDAAVAPNFVPNESIQWNIGTIAQPTVVQQPVVDQSAARPELGGRVEQNGQVPTTVTPLQTQTVAPQTKVVEQVDDVVAPATTNIASTALQLPETKSLIQPVETVQVPQIASLAKIDGTVVPATNLSVAPVVKENYIDTAVEKNQQPVAIDGSSRLDINLAAAIMPINISADRIDFVGERRPEIVAVLMKALANENGSLSSDYSIAVKQIEGGQFKAVLFEYGKVKKVLILGLRDGSLNVLTEISY